MTVLRRLALLPLEQSINQLLHHDPRSLARLEALAGHCIAVRLTTPPLRLFLLPRHGGVSLRLDPPPTADVQIVATLPALVAYLGGHDSGPALQLQGDAELAGTLQSILAQLDIDWEAALSRLTGGLLAHQTGRLLRATRRQLARGGDHLTDMVANWLVEESHTLPAAVEVARFNDAVDQLRFDSDRLEARLKRLERQRGGHGAA
ncbi:MAG TPA: SCP2 sterol-binding domain-containing protein [Pseudomonadales bacterium]|nr:SCP2 sterol-binding domain-containing protein [Pseudomonadales bacterium]